MQKKKWVRVGLSAVIIAGAFGGMAAAGCGGDDNSTPTKEAGADVTNGQDSNTPETSKPEGASETSVPEAGAPNAKVYLINAATDPAAPKAMRFCFGVASSADGGGTVTVTDSIDAFPDSITVPGFPFAGLLPGFGGSTAGSPKLAGINLSSLNITLFAIDAAKIATDTADGGPDGGAEVPCEGLVGTDGLGSASATGHGTLTEGTDYFNVGTIPSGTLVQGSTFVVAVTGCAPGEPAPTGPTAPGSLLCENANLPAYDATKGNLTLKWWQVDSKTTITAAAGLGAQFINTSPQWDFVTAATVAPDAGNAGTAAGFWTFLPPSTDGGTDAGDDGGDAGDAAAPAPVFGFTPITGTSSGSFGTILPATLFTVAPADIPLNIPAAGFATAIAGGPGIITVPPGCTPGTCLSPLTYPMPLIDEITNGATVSAAGVVTTPAGGSYAYGKGYVFVLVGDPSQSPTAAGGAFNSSFAHFLAFPTSNP